MTDNKEKLAGGPQNRPWITAFEGRTPQIHPEAFVDVSARIIGDVGLARGTSVWPMAVLRADSDEIRLAARAAVLDLALVEAPTSQPVHIGEEALISHGAMVHGARVESRALVGVGAIVLDGAVVGEGSLIGAGALITPGLKIPPNSLVLGSPGRIIRETTPEDRARLLEQIEELYQKSRQMMNE